MFSYNVYNLFYKRGMFLMPDKKKASINHCVYNAFEIVNYLAGKNWCRIKDISAALGMDPAKIHRLLKTMLMLDFIEYSRDTRQYRLGMAFYSITFHMSKGDYLINAAKQPMEWIAGELNETVNLFILNNLDKTKMANAFRIDGNMETTEFDEKVGRISTSVYNTAGGKCLLAYCPVNEQKMIAEKIHYQKTAANTITTPDKLLKELQKIREKGYAVDYHELNDRLYCVAMPVIAPGGLMLGSISVSTTKDPTKELAGHYLSVLEQGIKKLNAAL